MAVRLAKRSLQEPVDADLPEKMAFVSGPRQVGKATLALEVIGATDRRDPAAPRWDDPRARPRPRRGGLPARAPCVVREEICGAREVVSDGVRMLPRPALRAEVGVA